MAAITAVEMSRSTVTFYTLPHTIFVGFPLQPTLSPLDRTWQDRALVCPGGVRTDEGGSPFNVQSYDALTLDELAPTSITQTVYGATTIAAQRMLFGTFNSKLFYSSTYFESSGDLINEIKYFYVDYTEGGSLSPITFSRYHPDASWFHPHSVNQPISWNGLTNAVCLVMDLDDNPPLGSDVVVRGLIVDGSGLTDASQICVAPAAAYEGGLGPIHLMIPGVGKNYFLHRPDSTGLVTSMPVWTADDTGINLTNDELSFEASDVNRVVVNDYGLSEIGFWLATPDAFIFYCGRHDWDVITGDTPQNGLVIVTLLKDFSSYTIKFITWGDANAETILDNADQSGANLAVDATGRYYYSNGDRGTPGSFLSEFVDLGPPTDVTDSTPRFPDSIALGAAGGPGFKTSVAPGDRGTRFQEWRRVRGKYQIDQTAKDQSEVNELLTFFRARRGRAFPFRFKDWSDYQLPDPGSGLLFADLFVTNVTGGTVQLVKVYEDLAGGYSRTITRPVAGTVKVYDDGSLTTDYTVDYTTGVITLGATLGATSGHVISVSCEFDVVARFDTDAMTVSVTNFEIYSWKTVAIVELMDT